MVKDVKKSFDVLPDRGQQAVEAIMEAWGYSLEEAVEIVERGDYEFYPGIFTFELAKAGCSEMLAEYIDYERLSADLYHDNYRETDLGVVQIF